MSLLMSCLLNTSPNRVSLHNILAHAKITTTCFALFSAIRALKSKSLAPTTIRKKLVDVVVFAKWLKRASPAGVRLSQKTINMCVDGLRRHQKDLARDVVSHQQAVRRRKTGLSHTSCTRVIVLFLYHIFETV